MIVECPRIPSGPNCFHPSGHAKQALRCDQPGALRAGLQSGGHMKRTKVAIAAVVTIGSLWAMAGTASAHPHTVNGHPIANGQLHGSYNSSGDSCGGDPAAYGLETAHHGPDQGTPGRADGCYNTAVHWNGTRFVPNVDTNPAID